MFARYLFIITSISLIGCSNEFLRMRKSALEGVVETQPAIKSESYVVPETKLDYKKLDDSMYQFPYKVSTVSDALLNVIVKNYTILVLDKENGIISTDWDSYYVDSKLFRNKVTVRLKQIKNYTQVNIINVIESYDKPYEYAVSSPTWIPYKDGQDEIDRIVQNIGIVIASSSGKEATGLSRWLKR